MPATLTVLNTVLPVFTLIAVGGFLRQAAMVDERFILSCDRLIYYVFFPCLLFWKIGKPGAFTSIDWFLVMAVTVSVLSVFILSLLYARMVRMPNDQVGSFSQACYRFSTYVGMAIVLSAFGDEGGRIFGVLISLCIPIINVLAVWSLICFASGTPWSPGRSHYLVRSALSNPLILACVGGLFSSYIGFVFPIWLDKTLGLLSAMALPLALVCLGGSLKVTTFQRHIKASLIAGIFKLVLLPLIGYGILQLSQVQGISFKVAMIYFALPTSPNNYILSEQLQSDTDLASATIVVSTFLAVVSLSTILMLCMD